MKHFLLFVTVLCALQYSRAQNCTYTYFQNGQKASERCLDTYRRGNARVFNLEGKMIGEWMLSQSGYHANVRFSFHANGMIHQAHFSARPDAGIQWYKSTTTYDKNGVKIGFTEDSHDRFKRIIQPTITPQKKPNIPPQKKPKKKATPKTCTSELWLDNRTGKNVVIAITKNGSDTPQKYTLKIGERLKVGEISALGTYKEPMDAFSIAILKPSGKPLSNTSYGPLLMDHTRLKDHRKGYVYDLQ